MKVTLHLSSYRLEHVIVLGVIEEKVSLEKILKERIGSGAHIAKGLHPRACQSEGGTGK
jgi:hypothetical protein